MPQQVEATALRGLCTDVSPVRTRFVRGTAGGVAIADLAGATSLGGRLGALAGRSVLLATTDQLAAALALIELDGVARRIVLCPPGAAPEHLCGIIAEAAIDALISDRAAAGGAESWPEIPIKVEAGATLTPWDGSPRATHHTEWVLLTSGTTGAPKLARHDTASLMAPIKSAAAPPVWGTFYDIRRYGGLQIFFRAIRGGGSLILSSAAEPIAEHLRRLAAGGVTHLSGTPSHWRRVLMCPDARSIAPGHVRLSGEIADQAILDRLRAFYPRAAVGHAYASTEAGVGFEVNDGLEGFPAHFVGVGQGDVDIRVVDDALRLRSARTASGYVGTAPAALRDADGFVDTGDMVTLRGGRYYFVGRKGGIINVGGQKVHPEEVEAAINRHPDVSAALVRPRRSPVTGAIVVADVVLRDAAMTTAGDATGRIEREIDAICRRELAAYKVPAAFRFVAGLDLTAAGKLIRHA
jgi:acyl-CoA synthetase (AMP-forming)/AMP-acid ligase II